MKGQGTRPKGQKREIPFLPSRKGKNTFSFIDLFAGVGGFRLAMQQLGGRCVFSSEWDRWAQKTYEANFGEVPSGDITKISTEEVPEHDILCAGFPCQAFSLAGQRRGFEDTRGTLFFDIARTLKAKRPKAFFLENVKGLMSHRGGQTLDTILSVLRDELGYFVPTPQVIKAQDHGVPQKRGRLFLVGFHGDLKINKFIYPFPSQDRTPFSKVKEKHPVSARYYLSTRYLQSLRSHRARHEVKGNGFGFEIIGDDQVANTIVIGGMGRERNLVIDHRLKDFTPVTNIKGKVNREGIRRMTPREWARLQGYPDEFLIPVSDAQAYKQFANSVAVPAIKATATMILETLFQSKNFRMSPAT
jgi:DNA (cytosine-5)-methyltransferase 1|tara:strand:- start:13673 stop:14749 length:1077 start_codon:yes stop_codon:yes gene_type:complete